MSTFRLVGVPSSSMLAEPQPLGMVPSSMAVTKGDAICCPSFPANTEAFLATAVASSPCPQASWKITPPKPLSMTTGIFPAGQGFAPSMVMAIRAASLAVSSTLIWSKSSKPTEPPGPRCPLCFSVAEDATASTVKRLRTRLSSAQTPSELATNTFLVTSRKPVRVWVMA